MTKEEKERVIQKQTEDDLENREIINLINQAFYLYEAADMCIREAERKFIKRGEGLKFELKRLFNQIRDCFRRLESLVEQFLPYYNDAFESRIGGAYEDIQKSAEFYAIFALLCGDRLSTHKKEKKLLDYIRKFKSSGHISEETIEKIKLK